MTTAQIQLSTPLPTATAGGPRQVGEPTQTLPTAGSPTQSGKEPSWISKNIKLVGIVGGAVAGGALGFLTLGPVGGLGGAAVGALAGFLLTRNRTSEGSGSGVTLPPPPPLPSS